MPRWLMIEKVRGPAVKPAEFPNSDRPSRGYIRA